MPVPTVANCHTMTWYYQKAHKAKYGQEAAVNRIKARWSWDAMLRGMSMDEVKELIDFYFTVQPKNGHDLDWFFNNYEKLLREKYAVEKDRALVQTLKEQSQARAQAWKENIGKQRTTDDSISP